MPIFTYAGGLPPIMPGFAIHVPLNPDGTAGAQYLTMSPLGVSGAGGFGVPVVVGLSPNDVSTLLGLPIRVNPNFTEYFDNPCIVVWDQLLGSSASLAPFNVGSGTIGGQQWAWQCSCELYSDDTGVPVPPEDLDLYAQLVGSYVGNGTSQFISTGWDPMVVWVKPTSVTLNQPLPGGGAYRQSGMPNALGAGSSTNVGNAILLGAGGFTVNSADASNKNGCTYGFLAMKDPLNKRMAVGSYVGAHDHTVSGVTCTPGSVIVTTSTDQWVQDDGGLVIDFGGLGQFIFSYGGPRQGTLSSIWTSGPTVANPTMRVSGRHVDVGMTGISNVWLFAREDIYSAIPELPAPAAVVLANAAQSQTDLIISMGVDAGGGGFSLGASNNVNNAGQTFYWMALNANAAFRNTAFTSGAVAQTGGNHTLSMAFQPAWIVTQQFISFTIQPCWRQLGLQAGTQSNNYTDITNVGVSNQTTGITAINATDFHTGTPAADNGVAGLMTWYAFQGQYSNPNPDPGPNPGALAPQCPGTSGRVRWPYVSTLHATSGTLPYTWAVLYGTLPDGLVLQPQQGVISGTPTTVGTFDFIIRVTDATLGQALISSVTCSITIIDDGTSPPDGGGPPDIPPTLPVPPTTNPPTGPCMSCTTLATAITLLGDRLQDSAHVHWTSAELTRYLVEAMRTWNALTGAFKQRDSFGTTAAQPFYDLPTVIPATRSYNVKDIDLITDIQYNLMEPPTPTGWTGTLQFALADLTRALSHRRDRFLYETGMVVNRFVESIGAPLPTNGRLALDGSIMTVRRAAFIPPSGRVYPLTRDDEWSMQSFERGWPFAATNPTLLDPMVYSVGVTPPLIIQVAPPLNATGLLDLLVISRTGVGGQTTPCLDPTGTPTLMGIPDDWTWVVKFGALAELLNQQGVTYDPQRAAYCESRWQMGISMAAASATVLACQVQGQPIQLDSVAAADQYFRSWQGGMTVPTMGFLAGNNLLALGSVPDAVYVITLDVIQNAPVPASGADCLGAEAQTLDAVLDYAQHLAVFKEGPDQLRVSMDLYSRFLRAAGITNAVELASVMNRAAIQQQTTLDEIQMPRITTPSPVSSPQTANPGDQP